MAGGRDKEYSDDQFLSVIKEHEPVGVTETAEHIGCSRETSRLRLAQLEEQGEVKSKTVGKSLVYFLD